MVLSYGDSSWANAEGSKSQEGLIVVLTSKAVTKASAACSPMDWRSCRTRRVCRSTLAAEACAADDVVDRATMINSYLSEILIDEKSHESSPMLDHRHATDCKSLYDAAVRQNPSLEEKRLLLTIRSIQEYVEPKDVHWVPTDLMFADGLTKIDKKLRLMFRNWLQWPYARLRE